MINSSTSPAVMTPSRGIEIEPEEYASVSRERTVLPPIRPPLMLNVNVDISITPHQLMIGGVLFPSVATTPLEPSRKQAHATN